MKTLPLLKINGVPLKNPTDLKRSTHNLSNSGRVASGLMTLEIVARKAKLEVGYDVMSGNDFDKLNSLIDNGVPFFTVEHLNNGRYEKFTMYTGAIHAEKFRQHMGWYWKSVSFDLIEQ